MMIVATVTSIPPLARAHDGETLSDGNDSRSPLDIERVSLTHIGAKLLYEIRTISRFRARDLNPQQGRYFVIGFDKDRRSSDRSPFERCAFVFWDGRLRWVSTNCGRRLFARGKASQPNRRTLRVSIPAGRADVFWDHGWWAFSVWTGTPCGNRGCVDGVPDARPLPLHDFTPPSMQMPLPILSSSVSTTPTFPVDLTVSDPRGSGVETWELRWRNAYLGTNTFDVHTSGTTGGSFAPNFEGEEGGVYALYVYARDVQGNAASGDVKMVYVPTDDDSLINRVVTGATSEVSDPDAYGGSVTLLEDTTAELTFFGGTGHCFTSYLIGNGSGTWVLEIWRGTQLLGTVNAASIPDQPRVELWRGPACDNLSLKLASGSNAAIDGYAYGIGP
jgi:hypothetical protein